MDAQNMRRMKQLETENQKLGNAANGDAVQRWDAIIGMHTANGLSKRQAIAKAAQERPALHKEYLRQVNNEAGRKQTANRI